MRPGGWQGIQISNGPEGWATTAPPPGPWESVLRSIMDQSGHPVIAATTLDSDCGQLVGYSPKAGRWNGWLDQKTAAVHYVDELTPLTGSFTRSRADQPGGPDGSHGSPPQVQPRASGPRGPPAGSDDYDALRRERLPSSAASLAT